MSEEAAKFTCASCGKRYRWTSAVAGKTLRCVCGQPVTVPTNPNTRSPGLRADHWAKSMNPPSPAGPAVADDEPTFAVFDHPLRNIAFPVTFLVAGFVALIIWCSQSLSANNIALDFWILLAASSLPLIAIFIVYGMLNSNRLEITNASFGIAAVKLLAILAFTDAAVLWIYYYFHHIGAIARQMYIGLSTVWLVFGLFFVFAACTGIVIWGAAYCLFSSQDDDFVAAGPQLAFISWLGHFVLFILMIAIPALVLHIVHSHTATVAAATTPPPATAPVVATASAVTQPPAAFTKADLQLESVIRTGIIVEWRQLGSHRFAPDPVTNAFAAKMYAAGATGVFIDGRLILHGRAILAYVQLPSSPTARAACRAAAINYLQEKHLPPMPPNNPFRRYIPMRIQ